MRPPAALLSTRDTSWKRVAMSQSALSVSPATAGESTGSRPRDSAIAPLTSASRSWARRAISPARAVCAAAGSTPALCASALAASARTRGSFASSAGRSVGTWSIRSRRPTARTAIAWNGEGVVAAVISSASWSDVAARAASAWMMATRVTPG